MAQRITGIMDGQPTPLGVEPELAGIEHGWEGFLLEAHVAGPHREEIGWSWQNTHIGLCLHGEGTISVSGDMGEHRYRARPGIVTLFPQNYGPATIRQLDGRCRFVVVELDMERLGKLFPDVSRMQPWLFTPLIDKHDPQIANLLTNMYTEVTAECPSGTLFAESLSLALAAYLSGRYSAQALDKKPSETGLSQTQRARTLEFIAANLDLDISLTELARIIDLSPRHFSRLFRHTFGTTPHRYIMALRIKRAKELLTINRQSVAEVAFLLGFNSQSHFTNVFHKATGVTPVRYRQSC